MPQYYYIDVQGNQIGPVEKNQLYCVITPSTMVWCEGMAAWTPAGQVADLMDVLQRPTATPPPPGTGYQQQPNYGYQTPQQPQQVQPKPESYMWLGILTTLLCCLPFGIVSIVYASKVDSYWVAGNYEEAYNASQKAKNWGIAAAITSIVIGVIYFASAASLIGGALY